MFKINKDLSLIKNIKKFIFNKWIIGDLNRKKIMFFCKVTDVIHILTFYFEGELEINDYCRKCIIDINLYRVFNCINIFETFYIDKNIIDTNEICQRLMATDLAKSNKLDTFAPYRKEMSESINEKLKDIEKQFLNLNIKRITYEIEDIMSITLRAILDKMITENTFRTKAFVCEVESENVLLNVLKLGYGKKISKAELLNEIFNQNTE